MLPERSIAGFALSRIALQLAPKTGKADRMIRIPLLVVLPTLFVFSLSGDTVELKNGERIEGTFKQANADQGLVIEVAAQPITIPLEKVKAIYFGSAPAHVATSPNASQEALESLKALRSVTSSGIPYRDYSQRVLDAKIKVDRYTSSSEGDSPDVRNAITLAMREYEFASQGWGVKFNSGGQALAASSAIGQVLMTDPEISKCPGIRQLIDSVPPKLLNTAKGPNYSFIGIMFSNSPNSIWACASAQVAEAERLLALH